MRWSLDMDRMAFIFTRSRRSPLQGAFRWSFPRPEGLGCSVKPLRGRGSRLALQTQNPSAPLPPGRLPVFDRLDRCSTKTRRPFVANKCEFHPAAAEQMPRLKRVTKAEPASRNSNSAGRPIAARTEELNLLAIDHGENVVCMLRNNSKRVTRVKALK